MLVGCGGHGTDGSLPLFSLSLSLFSAWPNRPAHAQPSSFLHYTCRARYPLARQGGMRKQGGEMEKAERREREREGGLIQFNYVMNCRVLSKHPSSPRLAAGKSPVGGYTLLARRRGWSGGGQRLQRRSAAGLIR